MLRRLLSLCLICLAGLSAQAQDMIGFRQGPDLWLSRYGIGQGSVRYANGQHFTWSRELFFRSRLKEKWAWETSLSAYRFRNAGTDARQRTLAEQNDVIEAGFSLQYDVTSPLIGYMFHGAMQGMSSHIGFRLSPALSFNRYLSEDRDGNFTEQRDRRFSMMLGFTYTHIIPLTRRLQLVSQCVFSTNSFSKYGSVAGFSRPNKSIGWHTGIAYAL